MIESFGLLMNFYVMLSAMVRKIQTFFVPAYLGVNIFGLTDRKRIVE